MHVISALAVSPKISHVEFYHCSFNIFLLSIVIIFCLYVAPGTHISSPNSLWFQPQLQWMLLCWQPLISSMSQVCFLISAPDVPNSLEDCLTCLQIQLPNTGKLTPPWSIERGVQMPKASLIQWKVLGGFYCACHRSLRNQVIIG